MIIKFEDLKLESKYRVKIKPVKDLKNDPNHDSRFVDRFINKNKINIDDPNELLNMYASGLSFDLYKLFLYTRPQIAKLYKIDERNKCLGFRIEYMVKDYGLCNSTYWLHYDDFIMINPVIVSDHYFSDRITDNGETIKLCHMTLTKSNALELIEKLNQFIGA